MKNEIAPERLHETLVYEPDTGLLRWKVRQARCVEVGGKAGHITKFGYLRVAINGRRYSCHRVAWAMHYGAWPDCDLDHINGVRNDNRIANLRLATRSQNSCNRKRSTRNKVSGVKGVSFVPNKRRRRWRAHIRCDGRAYALGHYDCLGQAARAYHEAALWLHGEFKNPGTHLPSPPQKKE